MLLNEYLDKTCGFGTLVNAGNGLFNQTKTYKEIADILTKYGYAPGKPKCDLKATFVRSSNHVFQYRFNTTIGIPSKQGEYPHISIPFDFAQFPLCCGVQWFAGWANIPLAYTGLKDEDTKRIVELAVEYFFLCHMYVFAGKPMVCIGTSNISDHDIVRQSFNIIQPYIVGGLKNRLEFKNLGYPDHGLDVVLLAHPFVHEAVQSKRNYMAEVRSDCTRAKLEI